MSVQVYPVSELGSTNNQSVEAVDDTLQRREQTLKVVDAVSKFCSKFEAAVDSTCRSSLATSLHCDTIKQALNEINLNDTLSIDNAYLVFKSSYGYKNWLLMPEDSVRGVLKDCLLAYEQPLYGVVDSVHKSITEAAKHSHSKLAKNSTADAVLLQERLLERALTIIDAWRDETKSQLTNLLHSEASFPSRERFEALKKRLQVLMMQSALLLEAERRKEDEKLQLMLQPSIAAALGQVVVEQKKQPGVVALVQEEEEDISWSQYFMGWLEKQNRHGSWQRRWVAISPKQQKLYYFRDPEEQPAHAALSLIGAVTMERTNGGEEHIFKIIFHPEAPLVNLNTGLATDDPVTGSATKTNSSVSELTLKAKNASGKHQWLEMIHKAIEGVPDKQEAAAVAKKSTNNKLAVAEVGGENTAERKISTVVYAESATAASSSTSEEVSRQSSACSISDEAAAQEAANDLYNEILKQSQERKPDKEQIAVLECVIDAVREYTVVTRARLAEASSKIVSKNMLPVGDRIDSLRDGLLEELDGLIMV